MYGIYREGLRHSQMLGVTCIVSHPHSHTDWPSGGPEDSMVGSGSDILSHNSEHTVLQRTTPLDADSRSVTCCGVYYVLGFYELYDPCVMIIQCNYIQTCSCSMYL